MSRFQSYKTGFLIAQNYKYKFDPRNVLYLNSETLQLNTNNHKTRMKK